MAEEDQAPPPWLQQLGQTLNQQSQQIAALTHTVQRATAPQPQAPVRPAPPATPTAEVRERILSGLVNEPERVIAEIVGFADQNAERKMNDRIAWERQQTEQNFAQREFWRQFHAANPDMQGFQAEVWNAFNSLDPSVDPSIRANTARDSVRSRIQQVIDMSHQQEKQAQEQRRLMAGAPGGAGYGAQVDPVAEAADEFERTKDALMERRAYKAQRLGHNLRDDSEYHEARRQETLRKKGAEAQRRAG